MPRKRFDSDPDLSISGGAIKKIGLLLFAVIILVVLGVGACTSIHDVGADEIVVLQTPSGHMEVWSTPGWKLAVFGKTTTYKKSDQYTFMYEQAEDGNVVPKDCISTRFNDQGSANICGSLSFDLPTDEKTMLELHNKFRSMEGIVARLVKPAVVKSVYNSGGLMSSKESAGKKRADLIQYVGDQATRGTYKTTTREGEVEDLLAPPVEVVEMVDSPVLDEEGKPKLDEDNKPIMTKVPRKITKPATKKIVLVEPLLDENSGQIMVQEESTVTKMGITLYNITIERIIYEQKVKEQIDKQRDMTMKVQTKIAEAKEAQQNAVTAEETGKAGAAKAKWDQEILKAKAVTAAEQKREVAEKDLEAAKLERQAQVERAKGEAESKKLVMAADGALDKKLQAWVEVQKAYAAEIGKQRWVPEVVMGGGGGNGAQAAQGLMQLWQVQAARQLNLDRTFR